MSKAILSMLDRARKAQSKFSEGTSQHTLQRNRIAALEVALKLVNGEHPEAADIEAARKPIASLISKSEKANTHFTPDKWQYKMLSENLQALRHAQTLIEKHVETERNNA